MGTPSLDRLAGPFATAVGIGGLLYGALFAWIVVGPPSWVPDVWFALLAFGAFLSVAVGVAVFQRLRVTDEGLALTALLLGFAGALGGVVHGAFNLAAQINPASVGRDNVSPDPGGIFRYATSGIALMLVGWLVVSGRGVQATQAGRTLPVRFGWLALGSGAVLIYIYVGRLYDFITPAHRISLWAPLLYGLVLHPALYLWLGRLLAPAKPPPA